MELLSFLNACILRNRALWAPAQDQRRPKEPPADAADVRPPKFRAAQYCLRRRSAIFHAAGSGARRSERLRGMTPALVCQLFGSKEGLYDALLEKLALDQQTQLAELVRLADLAERYPKAAFERWVQMLVQIGPAISDVPALLMHEVDPMPEEHDNGESRIPRITEKLVRPFKRASMPILNKALEAGIIRGTSPDLVFSLLMGAVSATLLAPQISGESPAANMDFRERAAENLLLLVLK